MTSPAPSPAPRHTPLEDVFRTVIPPRAVPLRKRVFWHVLLGLLALPPTRALLLRLRRGA